MRKTRIFFIIFVMLTLTVNAEIPGIFTEIPDFSDTDYFSENAEKVTDALMPENVFEYMLSVISSAFSDIRTSLISIITVVFLSSAVGVFTSEMSFTGKIPQYSMLLVTMLMCFRLVEPLILKAAEYLERYVAFMTAMTGTMSALLVSSGSVSASAAEAASAAFISGLTQICSVNIVLPCVRIVTALSVIGALSDSLDLSGVISFIRSFCTWGLGVLFAVFGGIHSVAVKMAGAADSLAVRGIRFTAARLIPVAGNMVSESMRTVISGINVIKTGAGGFGIAYILYSLIPTLAAVLGVKIAVLIGIFCSRLMGARRHSSFLDGINGALNILLAVCIFASVNGIIIFAVFIGTTAEI